MNTQQLTQEIERQEIAATDESVVSVRHYILNRRLAELSEASLGNLMQKMQEGPGAKMGGADIQTIRIYQDATAKAGRLEQRLRDLGMNTQLLDRLYEMDGARIDSIRQSGEEAVEEVRPSESPEPRMLPSVDSGSLTQASPEHIEAPKSESKPKPARRVKVNPKTGKKTKTRHRPKAA